MAQALETVVLDSLEIDADPAEVLRYLGYPAEAAPDERAQRSVKAAIRAARGRQRPRGMYSTYRIAAQDRTSLELADGTTFRGSIGEFLGGATHAAAFLATAGPEVERLGEEAARGGEALLGLAFHALGSHLA